MSEVSIHMLRVGVFKGVRVWRKSHSHRRCIKAANNDRATAAVCSASGIVMRIGLSRWCTTTPREPNTNTNTFTSPPPAPDHRPSASDIVEKRIQVLFQTSSSGINAYRLYGAVAYSIFGVGLYLAPQLLAEHDWAPLWLRSAMAGMVLFFGGGLVPLYAFYLKKNLFNVSIEHNNNDNHLVVTTLSPLLFRTEDTRIPLSQIHPEPRQGKWLRLIVRDPKYGDKKLKTLYLERTGKFVQYRQLESIVKTGTASSVSSASSASSPRPASTNSPRQASE